MNKAMELAERLIAAPSGTIAALRLKAQRPLPTPDVAIQTCYLQPCGQSFVGSQVNMNASQDSSETLVGENVANQGNCGRPALGPAPFSGTTPAAIVSVYHAADRLRSQALQVQGSKVRWFLGPT